MVPNDQIVLWSVCHDVLYKDIILPLQVQQMPDQDVVQQRVPVEGLGVGAQASLHCGGRPEESEGWQGGQE